VTHAEVLALSATALAAQIRSGRVRCVQAMEAVLARANEIQQRLNGFIRIEAERALGAAPQIEAFEQLNFLPYTEAATREAMRLRPVAPVLSFEALEDTQAGGYPLAAGGIVGALMRLPGIDPQLLDAPEAFRPARWLGAEDARLAAARKALMPFGGGPRFCPGRYLALAEIKMVATMLARNFRITRQPGAVGERYQLSMMPTNLRVRLEARA